METVTFALTPHLRDAFVQRHRYVDAILRRMERKSLIRENVLARRDTMPEETRVRKSKAICARAERELAKAFTASFASHGYRGTENDMPTVAVFASMRSEVDTRPFIEAAYAHRWNVCFPCMVRDEPGDPPRMQFYRVSREQLEAARTAFLDTPLRCLACDALEGFGYDAVAADELDAVLVPLVAFDDAGNRLGYGGGNYDRLLPLLREDAAVAGIAFDEQRVDEVPCEPHDRPLRCVISA